uniref:Uncharacterized protein n=1 Tax=Clandestinovirus TaxID=2831644 RepID=A0A8F8KTS5_9VIRU|nr:hypothetical protein KOM_12_244 [Clandestinovirus]
MTEKPEVNCVVCERVGKAGDFWYTSTGRIENFDVTTWPGTMGTWNDWPAWCSLCSNLTPSSGAYMMARVVPLRQSIPFDWVCKKCYKRERGDYAS